MSRTAAPANVRLLKGRNAGVDSGGRKVPQAPKFRRVPPEKPVWLSGEASDEWDRVLPELMRLQLVKAEDAAALASYCEAWATFVTATATWHREGMTIEAKQGTLAHPAVAIARNAGRELRAWAAHFGLTPSTEQALGGREASSGSEDVNPFEAEAEADTG
jgi:P27 family predicted phage terminase small subunit